MINISIEDIKKLAKEKGYVVLAHNYQLYDLQQIADFVGDSLQLAQMARKIEMDKILFLGVDFMAEMVKALNIDKKVIVPVRTATCPMANSLEPEMILEAKKKYGAPFVIYVNSTLEAKQYADYLCTSANAVEVVSKIDSDVILFGPDKNLANYVAEKTGKKVIPVPGETGYCYVHNYVTLQQVLRLKNLYPKAKVVVHPEVPKDVRTIADYVGSTSQMEKFVALDESKEFIIVTEKGMVDRLKALYPNKKFYGVNSMLCYNMKKNNLKNVYKALQNDQFEINVEKTQAEKLSYLVQKMLEMSR
ncbi:quinolinate synthase NadA [Pseudothermotoga thermarum]|uniref:Quinolinate synthase n=1 Tax=Pseudothermotoga thermarum DSM 5069 TaxID=688269 RepID=F7YWX7_9THEM|nr:quinolinate synthase NadA [Pseudothermotoga thermarum]AEH50569.1 quinolinate synthetase A [Pseudothermotoga thermarum DSM 5069]